LARARGSRFDAPICRCRAFCSACGMKLSVKWTDGLKALGDSMIMTRPTETSGRVRSLTATAIVLSLLIAVSLLVRSLVPHETFTALLARYAGGARADFGAATFSRLVMRLRLGAMGLLTISACAWIGRAWVAGALVHALTELRSSGRRLAVNCR